VFIVSLVPLASAAYKPLLIAAWACFALVLILELIGFVVSSFRFTLMIEEADKGLSLQEGEYPARRGLSAVLWKPKALLSASGGM
jgi:hypothetical protein